MSQRGISDSIRKMKGKKGEEMSKKIKVEWEGEGDQARAQPQQGSPSKQENITRVRWERRT